MEGGREGEIINELALPVTPRWNPGLEAALHWPRGPGTTEGPEEEEHKRVLCLAAARNCCFL